MIILAVVAASGVAAFLLHISRESSPRLPGIDELAVSKLLPDPFRYRDGSRVETRADWDRRRLEIKQLLLDYKYGSMPSTPDNVTAREVSKESVQPGGETKRMLLLSMGPEQRLKLYLGLIVPQGRGPFPVILNIDHREAFAATMAVQVAHRGYIFAGYDPNHLDPDEPGVTGMAQAVYPDRSWGTIAVWAWGAMRVLDHLLTMKIVDQSRIVVTGHSRSGKTALMAGAFDERFAVVAPMGSGCGGMGSYRFRGRGSETLEHVVKQFSHWFHHHLGQFAAQEERLPFDQHFLVALVAPRALLSVDALGDLWANPFGTQQTYRGALPVFKYLAAAQKLGIIFRPGGHEQTDDDWRALLDFTDWVFFGKAPSDLHRFKRLPFENREKILSWSMP